MKRIVILILALAGLAGCAKWNASHSKDFTYTGCAAETRTSYIGGVEPSLLSLKYEDGDLRVTRTNAMMGCAIKERGLACKVYVEGNVIHYYVDYESDGNDAACICPVDKLSSLVTGLHEGKEYHFYYCGLDRYCNAVTFTFNKGLHEVFDVEILK